MAWGEYFEAFSSVVYKSTHPGSNSCQAFKSRETVKGDKGIDQHVGDMHYDLICLYFMAVWLQG